VDVRNLGPQQQAGIDMKKPGGGYQFIDWEREHPIEDDLKMLKWSDEKLDGKGFVNWYTVQHPQLGEVELGGWNDEYCFRNPPPHLLEKEIAPHADFIIWHALISPRLEFGDVKVESLGDGATHIIAVILNTGWLPTSVSGRAEEKKLIRQLEVEIAVPDGAVLVSGKLRVEAGQLAGRALKLKAYWPNDPTDDRVRLDWVVRAPAGSTVTLKATHQRAGKVSRTVTL
jgi:hypothetical protein